MPSQRSQLPCKLSWTVEQELFLTFENIKGRFSSVEPGTALMDGQHAFVGIWKEWFFQHPLMIAICGDCFNLKSYWTFDDPNGPSEFFLPLLAFLQKHFVQNRWTNWAVHFLKRCTVFCFVCLFYMWSLVNDHSFSDHWNLHLWLVLKGLPVAAPSP